MDTADERTPAQIEDFAWRTIVAGYLARDEVIDAVTDHARGSIEPAEASELVQRLWEQRLQTEQRWPAVTDCDRLAAAFRRLTDDGLLTRQNYGCCLPHAVDAIVAERAAAGAGGFVFFSEPDTDGAVDGQGLFLAFGAIALSDAPDEEKAERVRQVGAMTVAALRATGLHTEWAGGVDDRIWVDLDWERRLPAGVPVP